MRDLTNWLRRRLEKLERRPQNSGPSVWDVIAGIVTPAALHGEQAEVWQEMQATLKRHRGQPNPIEEQLRQAEALGHERNEHPNHKGD